MERIKNRRLLGVAIAALVASLSSASIPRAGESAPLEPLADWLQKTGKPSLVRSRILEAMNLSARDMPVREIGFRHQGERITHVCSVSTVAAYKGLIFFGQVDESDGSAIVWRTSFDGRLVSTVQFTGGVVERLPNEAFKAGFETEKLIFLTRMRMKPASSRTPPK